MLDDPAAPAPVLEKAAQGYRTTVTTQAIRLLCKVVSVVVLARLVSPHDHGLFAMASSAFALIALFRDGGLSTAAVQARELNEVQRNTLFWVHFFLGGVLAAITLVIAPWTARFYAAPAVTSLLTWMSLGFVLIGTGGFMRAQLYRNMRFHDANRLETISAVAGTIGMVLVGAIAANAYAFVAFLLISEATATGLAWRCQSWRPTQFPAWRSLRPLLRTGRNLTLHQLAEALLLQLDTLAIGRWFGAYPLGLYNRASQLITLPGIYLVGPLGQIMLATLARLAPQSPEFKRHAWGSVTAIAHLILPLFAVCIALPAFSVQLVLGPEWLEAAPLIRILAIGGIGVMLTSLAYSITVALGHAHRLVVSTAIALPVTGLAIWIGSTHGVVGIASGVAIANLGLALPRVWWLLRELPGGGFQFLRALRGPCLTSTTLYLGISVTAAAISTEMDWVARASGALVGGLALLAGLGFFSGSLRQEWKSALQLLPSPLKLPPPPSP